LKTIHSGSIADSPLIMHDAAKSVFGTSVSEVMTA
jgi:hypothetical protein